MDRTLCFQNPVDASKRAFQSGPNGLCRRQRRGHKTRVVWVTVKLLLLAFFHQAKKLGYFGGRKYLLLPTVVSPLFFCFLRKSCHIVLDQTQLRYLACSLHTVLYPRGLGSYFCASLVLFTYQKWPYVSQHHKSTTLKKIVVYTFSVYSALLFTVESCNKANFLDMQRQNFEDLNFYSKIMRSLQFINYKLLRKIPKYCMNYQ